MASDTIRIEEENTLELAPLPIPNIDLDAVAAVTSSAVFSDVCDRLGMRSQTAEPGIQQLCGRGVLIGWARTALALPVDAPPERHYGNEIDFIDSLRQSDVAVIDCSQRAVAAWGELFSTASKGRGARGAVIDGMIRDRTKIEALGFAVFGRGCRPTDSLGRVSITKADLAIGLAGVRVRSGDLVIADADGVTIVPRERAEEAVGLAVEKATTEDNARELLLQGGTLAAVWERFRVL